MLKFSSSLVFSLASVPRTADTCVVDKTKMYSQTLRSSWVGAGRAGTQWDWWRGVRGSRASCLNCSSPAACCSPPPPSWKVRVKVNLWAKQPSTNTITTAWKVRVKVSHWTKQTSTHTITTAWKQSGSRTAAGQNKLQQTPSLQPENRQGQGQPLGKTNFNKHHHYSLKTVRVKDSLWEKQTSTNTITTAWKQSGSRTASGKNKLQQTPTLQPENSQGQENTNTTTHSCSWKRHLGQYELWKLQPK